MFRIVLTALFLAFLCPVSSWAQGAGAYTVQDVKVDILAESAMKARNQAFTEAESQAFKMLASRFLDPEQLKTFTPPDVVDIAGMVADFEVTSEQSSKRRYLGTYVFRFKAAPVNRFFGHGPVVSDAAAAETDKVLLIPIFIQKSGGTLWDLKNNPWLQAWQNNADKTSSLIIPPGDVSDKMDIRSTLANDISASGLKRIKARYDVNDVVIVEAVFDQAAQDILKVNIYRTDRGSVQLIRTDAVPRGTATKLGELMMQAVAQTKQILSDNWKGEAGTITADAAAQDASEAPTTPPTPYTPQAGKITAVARFAAMTDWLAMRRALNNIPPLQSLRIVGLTTNQASMELMYSDWSALKDALSARGFVLQPSTAPGEYNLLKVQ